MYPKRMAYKMTYTLKRADGKPFTLEDVETAEELLSLMVDFCEARGFYMYGHSGPENLEGGEGKDGPD